MCEDRNRFPEPGDGPLDHDGANVRFAPVGGHPPNPEVFLASVLDGGVPQQSAKDFSPATIRARCNVVMSLGDFPSSANRPDNLRSPKNRITRFPINED